MVVRGREMMSENLMMSCLIYTKDLRRNVFVAADESSMSCAVDGVAIRYDWKHVFKDHI